MIPDPDRVKTQGLGGLGGGANVGQYVAARERADVGKKAPFA